MGSALKWFIHQDALRVNKQTNFILLFHSNYPILKNIYSIYQVGLVWWANDYNEKNHKISAESKVVLNNFFWYLFMLFIYSFIFISLCTLMSVRAAVDIDILLPIKPFFLQFLNVYFMHDVAQ